MKPGSSSAPLTPSERTTPSSCYLDDDHVEYRTTSFTAATVGFFFSFRTILALLTGRWLNLGTEAGVIAGLVFGFLLLLLTSFQATGQVIWPIGWIMRLSTIRWVLFFLAFSCCSLSWSGTVSPLASFLYWSGMAADVATIILLFRAGSVPDMAHSIMKGFIWSTCILAAIAWMMPAQSDLRLGDEDYFNTNQIGNVCAMGIFMAQFLVSREERKWRLTLLFLTVTLLRSLSKATLAAFIVSQTFLLIRDRSMSRKKKALLALGFILVVLMFWGLIGAYYSVYSTAGNQAETLTGRTAIWAYTLDASLEKPWVGNGIDSMWKVFPPFGNELFEARHAENELLQQFFAYGVVGIALLAALYGSLYRRIRRLPSGRSRMVLISIIVFIVIRGLAEAEPFDLLLPLWMITLMSCIVDDPHERGRENTNLRNRHLANPAHAGGFGTARSLSR